METELEAVDEEENPERSFLEKKQDMEYEKYNTINYARAKEGVAQIKSGVMHEIGGLVSSLVEGLTPEFVTRMKYKKKYPAKIAAAEEVPEGLASRVETTIEEEKKLHDLRVKEQANRKKKIKKGRAHDNVQQRHHREARKVEVKMDFHAARARLRAQAKEKAEAEAAAKREQEERMDRDKKRLRQWRQDHWTKERGERYEEAKEAKAKQIKAVETAFNQSITSTYDEWADRDVSRTRMQVEAPILSGSTDFPSGKNLGIFGIPKHPGAFHAIDGGKNPALDQADIHVFSSSPQTEYEEGAIETLEVQAEVARNQTLYDALLEDGKELDRAMERVCNLRDTLERELRQIENEQAITDRELIGPPRRFPTPNEAVAINIRKTRIVDIRNEIEKLQHTIDVSDKKKRRIDAQMLAIAKKLATSRELLKRKEAALSDVNGGMGMLPVVVGRNISKVQGMDATANPRDTLNAISHQSRLVDYQDQSNTALKVHREGVIIDRNLWLKKQGSSEVRVDVERTLNKLAHLSERLRVAHVENCKLSMIDALRAFHHNRMRLNQTTKKLVGPLCWWRNRKPALCNAVHAYDSQASTLGGITFDDPIPEEEEKEWMGSDGSQTESESEGEEQPLETDKTYGVSLKGGKNKGFCVGTIDLPRPGMWNICFIVCRRGTEPKYAHTDPKDHVVVRMGHNHQNLKEVGTFYNVINPETGAVLYDVKYLVRGNTVSYRFEFSSSSMDANHHMIVSSAMYEEFELLPLETVSTESGRERVLSSYVKMLKLEESQGKMRLTKLIEELLLCEEAECPAWDSEVIQNYPQRYTREYFLRILRAEILVEREKEKRTAESAIDRYKDPFGGAASNKVGMTQDLYEKLERSEERFVKRKQETQYPLIRAARELVGKRMDIYDKIQNIWRTVVVHNCVVKWVEGGHVVRIRHRVQEVNKYDEKIGQIFEADLLKMRAVESPVQTVDKEAVEKLLEFRAWEGRLAQIDQEAKEKMKQAKKLYKKQYSRGTSTIRSLESSSVASFESRLDEQQDAYIASEAFQDAVKSKIPDITDAIKHGRIKADITQSPEEQALEIAKQRVISDWRDDQRNILERQITRQTSRIKQDVGAVARSYQLAIEEIKAEAAKEKAKLEKLMSNAIKERKEALLKRVRFKPKEFAKAVPKAPMCEHIRAKAWGNEYATGVRCLVCGRELTELYKDESQSLGYGSGADPWMVDALKRHRENEAAFRFKESKEITAVENERLRLEKERREMALQEEYFYDFQDLKAVYEFDRRHAKELKASGIFRQGLQWTKTELEYFERTKTIQELARLEREGIYSGSVMKDFDPLSHIEDPPPTFRATDERHKAQYRELMYTMGRMNNFSKRVIGLKRERIDLLSDRALYSHVLCALHKESFVREHELVLLEADLDRTGKMLATYQKMYKLWARANEILVNAQRDKKRAEMRQCGLWDEIKELKEEHTVLHEETRDLLKIKFTHELEIQSLVDALNNGRTMSAKLKALWEEEEQHAEAFQYCMPGSKIQTRYGLCEIVMYRHEDQMLMILLPFCSPPARAWIPARQVINAERNRQNGELKLMALEDERLKLFYRTERIECLKELYQMRLEERACRKRWEIEDLQATEEGILAERLEKSLYENYVVTNTDQFNADAAERVKKEFAKRMKDLDLKIKNYKGGKSGQPRKLSAWKKWKLKRRIDSEIRKEFILKGASRDRRQALEDIKSERKVYMGNKCVEDVIDAAVLEMLNEIAAESIREGNVAKVSAEIVSGIFFPTPVWMQYTTYCLLRDIWKTRKKELKNNIQIGLGSKQKFEMETKEEDPNDDNALKAAERRRQIEMELQRQRALCEEMDKEEKWARAFYHWEMKENLRERRLMKEEEAMMRKFIKEQEVIQQSMQSKYAGVSTKMAKQQERKAGVTDKIRRRNDLKDLTMERRKIREELALMRIEDALSAPLRDIDKRERQKKLLAKQLGLEDAKEERNEPLSEVAQPQPEGKVEAKSESKVRGRAVVVAMEVPEWMPLPRNWDKMNTSMQNRYIMMQQSLKTYEVQTKEKLASDKKLLEVVKRKNLVEWKDRSNALKMSTWNAELAYMVADEDCKEAENNLIKLKENVRRLTTFCQQKGEEELKIMTIMREKEEIARKRDRELEAATAWLEVCEARAKKRGKLKRRVESDCLWVDTDSVTGFLQRFRTERLRERLYWSFFREVIYSVITRAEIITTERKLMLAQEGLSQNRKLLITKTTLMKDLWREYQREELMRLKRSALNKKFFPKIRRQTLKETFSSWVRFYCWNRGHREAFELKYEVLKRKLDVERQFKKQLSKEPEKKEDDTFATAIQRHRDRPVECKRCHTFYLESQNTSISCHYHPETFSIACPRSCTNPGLSEVCIAHKKRRWTCCDSGDHKADGCARRYHCPVDSDPVYDAVMEKVVERDRDMLDTLNTKLSAANEENWVRRAMDMKRAQVVAVEKELGDARATAERFKNLKFD